jgi:hypothetical protein
VDLPGELRELGENCFDSCLALERITVPASVTMIDARCFNECGNLTDVIFEAGSNLAELGPAAFAESGLSSIQIPSSVLLIGGYCFGACKSLISVTFEEGSQLQYVAEDAFEGCPAHIDLPPDARDCGG